MKRSLVWPSTYGCEFFTARFSTDGSIISLLITKRPSTMSTQQPSKKLTLAAAAEALVEAASLEAESMTQKELAQNLDSLKASFDSNLNRVVQSVKSSNENFDAKMNTLNQHVKSEIGALKDEITAVKMLLEEEKKQKTLDRALKLAYHDSFKYYPYSDRVQEESGKLAEGVIGWFLLGEGASLPSEATLYHFDAQTQYTTKEVREEEDASKKAFRAKFVEQIKRLINSLQRSRRQCILTEIHCLSILSK